MEKSFVPKRDFQPSAEDVRSTERVHGRMGKIKHGFTYGKSQDDRKNVVANEWSLNRKTTTMKLKSIKVLVCY